MNWGWWSQEGPGLLSSWGEDARMVLVGYRCGSLCPHVTVPPVPA